ncbi:MAG: sensor histidine kinase [Bacteroidia bacterium]|nr:sensor histidine kinase [Bacteroidia bacterium]
MSNRPSGLYLNLIHVIFWVLLTLLGYTFANGVFPPEHTLLRTIANISLLSIIFYLNTKIFVNTFLEKGKYIQFALIMVVVFIVFYTIRRLIDNWISSYEASDTNMNFVRYKLRYFFGGGVAFIIGFSTMYQMIRNRFINEQQQKEKLQQETVAKLQYLKSQINPHLMFNMLNNIYSLVSINSPKAPEMILSFSELLRYTLYTTEKGTAFLSEEIEQMHRYIDLMNMKSENKMNVVFEINGNAGGKKIIPMILLPIVENCFKHSDVEENEKGFIKLQLVIENEHLLFKTSNSKRKSGSKNLSEVETGEKKMGEIGIGNIKERLTIMGQLYSIDFSDKEDVFELQLNMKLF